MKTVLIIVVAGGLGWYGGASTAIAAAEKNVTQYMQSSQGVEACRQLVRSAGG